jgi:hypothetical protein
MTDSRTDPLSLLKVPREVNRQTGYLTACREQKYSDNKEGKYLSIKLISVMPAV